MSRGPDADIAQQPAAQHRGAGARTQAELSVLIVDDDPLICKLLSLQLNGLGYSHCVSAHDGDQAMQALQFEPGFDLIICDLKMPGTDGIQFLRNAASRIPHVSVVLISSVESKILQSAASLAKAHHLNLLGTLDKPVKRAELKALIDRREWQVQHAPVRVDQEVSVADLRAALANGAIEPYFQPQVNVESGALVGAEALARWRQADAMVPPDVFIPLAQDNGLMIKLTECIMEGAVAALAEWKQQGLDITVSVNLSMESLSQLDFPEYTSALCQRYGLKPASLQIEITEAAAVHDAVHVLDVATRLRLQGFDLSIDDFGTGFSTLTQLREMPFNELKVDQSFVRMARLDHGSLSIVETNLDLARHLGMRSVAEGVETLEDWSLLRGLKCDVLQGYVVSAARPRDDFLHWAQDEYPRRLASGELPPP